MTALSSGIKSFITHRELLFAWTSRIIRARYQQSLLGGLWAVLQPAATVAIFTVIFTRFIRVNTGDIPYVVFSYSAMVPWIMFSTSITDMVDSLVLNMNLITKIYFPREILVTAALLARLLDFVIAFLMLVVLMVFYRIPVFTPAWIFLPAVILVQLLLALGIGLAGSALYVFSRDIKHLVALGLQLWFYATPIIYPVDLVPQQWLFAYHLNPMAGVIEAYRDILIHGSAPGPYLTISALIAIVVIAVSYVFFTKVQSTFADII